MVTPRRLINILISVVLFIGAPGIYAQTTIDSTDSMHSFHRKKADVLNYLLVDNFNNPALAGSLKSYQAQATYGHNLPGSASNIHYGNIMLDLFFGNKQGRHGLAYRLGMKHAGFSNSIKQRFDYSFQILNKQNFSLRVGVGIGFLMEQYVKTDLTFADQIDDRYGYVYSSLENPQIFNSAAFKVSRFQWNAGAQVRIYNGYINFYNTNDLMTVANASGKYNHYAGFGMNSLYNVQFKKMQMVPNLQFNYWTNNFYLLQGGIFLASNTSKGGGGGIYYNNLNVFTLSGMFAWDDCLRIYAQVQFPFSEIRYTYPVTNFQITVSYKINDFGKYE